MSPKTHRQEGLAGWVEGFFWMLGAFHPFIGAASEKKSVGLLTTSDTSDRINKSLTEPKSTTETTGTEYHNPNPLQQTNTHC